MAKIDVRNPRTGVCDYSFEPLSAPALTAACKALRSAQPAWAAAPLSHRVDVLRRWADAIEQEAAAITAALTLDTGRARMSAEASQNVTAGIRGWCDLAPKIFDVRTGRSSLAPEVTFSTHLDPYPLLAVISPWNFPFLLATVDAVPALLAGCAAIVKPSEITPRFIEPVRRSIAAVPELAEVLQFVAGDGTTGRQMIAEADIVVFTGSVRTGMTIAAEAAKRFIPAFLELGGKDPAIVTECADLKRAATAIVRGSVYASGQLCYSIERVYVQESVAEPFVAALEAELKDVNINYPDINQGHIGPLILDRQADVIRGQLEDAVARGAIVRLGGKIEEHGGLWLRPTILTNVNHQMQIMTEETFGPVIPVMTYKDVDEAVRLANDTSFGLSAAVIAGTPATAEAIGRRVNAGAVSLMDTTLTNTILRDAEKISYGYSGLGGSRVGPASLLRFVRKKTLITNPDRVQSLAELGEELPPARTY